jgi:RNA polymerase sigma-B factor
MLFARAGDGDSGARDALVERFTPLALRLASRYPHGGERADLEQVALLGLVKAIDRFDPDRGVAFTSFAVPTILGEVRRHLRDTSWALRVPRALQEDALRVGAAIPKLSTELGRPPTPREIAEHTELDLERVIAGMEASRAYEARSLDEPETLQDGEGASLAELIGGDDERFELLEDVSVLAGALRVIPDRDRDVLRLRFAEDLTQSEIAERIGISQMQVSRILRRTVDRLRRVAEASS